MTQDAWSTQGMPDQTGRLVIVTGGTNGIGLRTAQLFAEHGADVIVGARNANKGATVAADLQGRAVGHVTAEEMDLADLASIERFADRLTLSGRPVDLLVNCAGVMAIPEREVTRDGFERHLGTNHLGHFALTGRLLPLLRTASSARVITVSAQSARYVRLDLADLQSERSYAPMRAYSRSKLANILFAVELGARFERTSLSSVAVHPGTANTGIQQHQRGAVTKWLGRRIMQAVGQPLDHVADPIVFAATTEHLASETFVAPTGLWELGGAPGLVPLPKAALDGDLRQALWQESERLTGVHF